MLCETGTFVGNATQQKITTTWQPKYVIIKGDAAVVAAWHAQSFWVGRSNCLNNTASFLNGFRIVEDGFWVGTQANVNGSGTTYHWIAIGDDGDGSFGDISYMGNGLNGHIIPLEDSTSTPVASIIKRDGARPAAMKVGSNNVIFMDGSAPTNCITFGAGSLTLTSAPQVNEYDSTNGLGEGIEAFLIYDNTMLVTWTGNGVAGRSIPLGSADVCAAIIAVPTTSISSRIITDTMAAGRVGPCGAAALQANEGTLTSGNLVIGSTLTLNQNGSVYSAIVFTRNNGTSVPYPSFVVQGDQAVVLPGYAVNSAINCGNSNATLLINGAISIEWFGAMWGRPGTGSLDDNPMIVRSNAALGPSTASSWGLYQQQSNDFTLNWSGAQYCGQVANTMSFVPPLATCGWRTGILARYGQLEHIVMTIDGAGACRLYRNGVLVKTRNISVTAIASVSGDRTMIGARWSGGAIVRPQKCWFVQGSVYSRAITHSEVVSLFERAALGSSTPDVTTGLAERWKASDATGTSLPATVNAANNGTIVLGTIEIM